MDRHKLGIIVPYRNRPKHLKAFLSSITDYLKKKELNYEIIVVDQDNAKQFNRGMLLNIGFKYAQKLKCDYVVFHDVDMLPVSVDYSYSEIPLHLATNFNLQKDEKTREVFEEYFGGVTLFPVNAFQKINGYSNKYWGWGYEDTDLLLRCVVNNIDLNVLKIKNIGKKGTALKFNGVNSYVECENIIDLNNDATFFISFYPERGIFDHTKESDEFTSFSIPGWDFAICYNSFHRYNFCAFDSNHKAYYINSEIKAPHKTNMVIVLNRNEKYIKVYQDGHLIGQTEEFKKLYFYKKEPKFYLGAGKPYREKIPNLFRGTIDSFAYFDQMLSDEEIEEISSNNKNYLNQSFGKYKSKNALQLYYDADFIENYELIDLTNKGINGKIINCEIIEENYSEYTEVKVPHRRKSLFNSLKHDENGFLGNKWKDQATRWNQLRFNNEVYLNHELIKNDGLSDLEFIEHGKTHRDNILHVNVGI
jgi:predicted metal-dependent hydrolase